MAKNETVDEERRGPVGRAIAVLSGSHFVSKWTGVRGGGQEGTEAKPHGRAETVQLLHVVLQCE